MRPRERTSRRGRGEHGQVLILAVVALFLVVIATLLLFDVHTVILGKIKGQNGMDAAALTAAEWQKHSLNLIGELNLVRATGTLISDPFFAKGVEDIIYDLSFSLNGESIETPDYTPQPTRPRDFTRFPEEDEFRNSDGSVDYMKMIKEIARVEREITHLANLDDLVSQLQTRISFVGPLIGFGAAQQAAKNNHVFSNGDSGLLLNEYLKCVDENRNMYDPYGERNPEIINDYIWRDPYLRMLQSIFDDYNGIAAATRFNFVGMPIFTSDPPSPLSGYLGNKYFYQHIIGRNWCELDPILDLDYSGNWWNDFQLDKNEDFSRQSEILPLHIAFHSGNHNEGRGPSEEDTFSPYARAFDAGAFRGYPNNNDLISSVFNNEVPYEYEVEDYSKSYDRETGKITINTVLSIILSLESYNDTDADRRYNLLPLLSWAIYDGEWRSYTNYQRKWAEKCLERPLKEGMDYQSGAQAYFEAKQGIVTLSAANSTGRVKQGSYNDSITSQAEAKPIGRIKLTNANNETAYHPPFEAGRMVLPVFDDTALIPISLEPPSGNISMNDIDWFYFLTEYLPLLPGSSSLEEAWDLVQHPPDGSARHWQRYQSYYNALRNINNPDFRQRGRDWLDTPTAWDEGNRRPTRTRRDDCNREGGETMPTPSLN